MTGNPSVAQIKKALQSNGKPPAFVDFMSSDQTAALDGGRSQVADIDLPKPGTYALFCPLTDRDGGKPHFDEGLLIKVQVL